MKPFALAVSTLTLFLGSMSPAAHAECTIIDLRNLPGLGPVRNQKDKGWCYANAAADLMSVRYREKLQSQPTSSALIALQYNKTLAHSASADGGFTGLAALNAAMRGFCPQWVEDAVSELGGSSLGERMETFLRLKRRYDQASAELGYFANPEAIRHALEEIDAVHAIYNGWYQKWLTHFPDRTDIILSPEDMMRILNDSNENQFILEVFRGFCRNHYVPSFELPRIVSRIRPLTPAFEIWGREIPAIDSDRFLNLFDSLQGVINEGLEAGRIVALGYYAEFLFHDYLDGTPAVIKRPHASVIVGRRPSPAGNGCEYLIRNSWGSGCGYAVEDKHPGYCEAGHIWVPDSVLRQVARETSYFP